VLRIARIAVDEGARIGAERRERRQMPARGGAEQPETIGIDPVLGRIGAQELHRRHDVVHRLRKTLLALLGQPVADREQAVATRRQIRSPILECAARTLLPAAAMHGDERRKRPGALRQIEIALERDAVMGRIGQGGTEIMPGRACHWVHRVS